MNRKILSGLRRCLVNKWRDYIRAVFLSLLLGICSLSSAGEPSDDFRLFFPIIPGAKEEVVDSDVNITSSLPQQINSVRKKPTVKQVIFNGIVRSGNRILLLVNDLPCQVSFNDEPNEIVDSKRVMCAHMNPEYYSLKHQIGKQVLLVFKNNKYIATLFVGQGI